VAAVEAAVTALQRDRFLLAEDAAAYRAGAGHDSASKL
jgi:hypothetical protein